MQGVFFPHGVTGCRQERRWQVFKEVKDSVVTALQMPLTLRHLLRRGPAIAKLLSENRPNRQRQMQRLNGLIGSEVNAYGYCTPAVCCCTTTLVPTTAC